MSQVQQTATPKPSSELFRQFAGLAATACKPKYGGEVQFRLSLRNRPDWKPAGKRRLEFQFRGVAPISGPALRLEADQTWLARRAQSSQGECACFARLGRAANPLSRRLLTWSPLLRPRNLPQVSPSDLPVGKVDEMLIGGASFAAAPGEDAGPRPREPRFAARRRTGRQPALRPTRNGAARNSGIASRRRRRVNRRMQEPAELLVAGRVIARGEVVIVDGNYGLRITDIMQPHQRLESVETGAPHA